MLCFLLTTGIYPKAISLIKQKKNDRHIVKEVIEERTDNQKVFLNSDGTYTRRIYQKPIHFRNGDKYQEIDNTIVLSDSSNDSLGKSYKNKANNINVSLSENIGLEEPVSVGYDKYKVSFKPLNFGENTNVILKQLDENGDYIDGEKDSKSNNQLKSVHSIEYNDNKIGLRYTPINEGVKEEIVLNSYDGRNTFEFLTNLKGLEPVMHEDGQVLLLDKVSKEIKGVIPKPFMFDSSENKKSSMNVIMKIVKEKEKEDLYRITLVADKEFLENTETKYPVIIDPTIDLTYSSNISNSYVSNSYPDLNYSGNPSLNVGYYNIPGFYNLGITRSYVKLKSLPNLGSATILSAKYVAYNISGGLDTPTNIGLYRLQNDWSESTITWNNAPSLLALETSKSVSTRGQYYDWDIKNLVRDWYTGTPNYGFLLKSDDETSSHPYKVFSSTYGSTVPFIEITYDYPPVSPTGLSANVGSSGVNTSKGYVNLTWNAVSNATYIK